MNKNKVLSLKNHYSNTPARLAIQTESQDSLKEGLGFLLNRYIESQNQVMAEKIVQQIEKLLHHSDCVGFPNDRCTYYQLLRYWRAKAL